MDMKKILILLFINSLASGQVINFPDQNFKNKLLQASTSNFIAFNSSIVSYIKIDNNNDESLSISEEKFYTKR